MTAATYAAAMARVIADEGGYTDDPVDPGGATNWGITIFDAQKYWKADATKADVKAMPKSVAAEIYRKHYALPIRYDDLPAGFDYSVLDAEINSGFGRALPWSGKALGKVVKSIDEMVTSANACSDKVAAIQAYWAARLAFLHGLRTWSHFGGGWGRRCAQGEAAAVKMWLSIGAALAPADVGARMGKEAGKAKAKSKTSVAKAAGSGAATGAPAHPSIDVSHLGAGGKVLLGIFIAGCVVAAIYFIRQAITHNQRAAAYAAA